MRDAEHLIENAIYAMKAGEDAMEEMRAWPNTVMLQDTGMSADDVVAMACHVVYSLYGGKFPE